MRNRVFAALLLACAFIFPAAIAAHEIVDVEVDCDAPGIVVTGVKFVETAITITGPGDYLASAVVDGDFTEVFPIGDNGAYILDWLDSDEFGPVEFSVECVTESAPPSTTPTPPPTDTIEPQSLPTVDAAALALLAIGALVTIVLAVVPMRRGRR